jgi:hypothetical protein
MTSCQRPKECEPSSYRHGSDPPKQVKTASLSNSHQTLTLSSTQLSFDPFTYIRSKVTESRSRNGVGAITREVSSMSSSTITVVVPCAENEAVFLLYAVNAAIQAYRRGHVRSPELPVDTVGFDQGGENVSRAA